MNFITDVFKPGPETVLTSPHAPDACAEKLNAAIDGPMVMLGSKPAIGQAFQQSAWLKQRHGYRNSFQQVLSIAISPEGAGAKLSCRSNAPVMGQIFMIGWLAMSVLAFVVVIGNVARGFLSPVFLIVPVLIALFGFGMAMLGRNMSNADEPFLLDFLRRTLDAR